MWTHVENHKLFPTHTALLNSDFTENEILEAIKLSKNTTPGISGFPMSITKQFMLWFAPHITNVANRFLKEKDYKPNFLLQTLIVAIPQR
jgi:hypothetical protein